MEQVKERKKKLATVIVDNGQTEGCMLKLLEMKNKKVLCDVVINKGSTCVYAHACIIAANCPLFSKLLLKVSLYSPKNPLRLELHSLTKSESNSELNCIICFSKIIDFFYTGKIAFVKCHVSHILNFCSYLELDELYDAYQQFKATRDNNEPTDSKHKLALKQSNSNNNHKSPTLRNKHENEAPNSLKTILRRQFDGTYITDNNYDSNSCRKCNLQFKSSKKFEVHNRVFHNKVFICLSCNFTSHKLSFLIYHLSKMNHKEVYCSVCLYEASDEEALILHLEDHKRDYPYKCYACDFAFKTRAEWLKHVLIHKREHNCEHCSRSFLSRAALNSHLSTHKDYANYVCEICGFKATYKSTLERHLLKHKRENSDHSNEFFSCPVTPCPFTAVSKNALKEHLLNHTIEKVYICDLCGMKFTQEKNLRRHVETVHSRRNLIDCCRCDFKNARFDKAKKHCEKAHPNDSEALKFVTEQHYSVKSTKRRTVKKRSSSSNTMPMNTHEAVKSNPQLTKEVEAQTTEHNGESKSNSNESHSEVVPNSVNKSYLLSQTSGEYHILSQSEGEKSPLASFTSTNVLRIGNFREGTGSVTLNEKTGVVTFNNINSESTGAVFLNESTGELSYINLGKEPMNIDTNNVECNKKDEVQPSINELASDINDDLFFDMDIGNEDSFDDIDGLILDPIDEENLSGIDVFFPSNEEKQPKAVPHLNETTGELSFDYKGSQNSQKQLWETETHNFGRQINLEDDSLFLNEFTGEFS